MDRLGLGLRLRPELRGSVRCARWLVILGLWLGDGLRGRLVYMLRLGLVLNRSWLLIYGLRLDLDGQRYLRDLVLGLRGRLNEGGLNARLLVLISTVLSELLRCRLVYLLRLLVAHLRRRWWCWWVVERGGRPRQIVRRLGDYARNQRQYCDLKTNTSLSLTLYPNKTSTHFIRMMTV